MIQGGRLSGTCALSRPWEGVYYPRTGGIKTSVLPYSFDEQSCTAAKAGATRLASCCGIGIGGCSVAPPPWCPFFAPGLKTLALWLRAKFFFPVLAPERGLRDARSIMTRVNFCAIVQ